MPYREANTPNNALQNSKTNPSHVAMYLHIRQGSSLVSSPGRYSVQWRNTLGSDLYLMTAIFMFDHRESETKPN